MLAASQGMPREQASPYRVRARKATACTKNNCLFRKTKVSTETRATRTAIECKQGFARAKSGKAISASSAGRVGANFEVGKAGTPHPRD